MRLSFGILVASILVSLGGCEPPPNGVEKPKPRITVIGEAETYNSAATVFRDNEMEREYIVFSPYNESGVVVIELSTVKQPKHTGFGVSDTDEEE